MACTPCSAVTAWVLRDMQSHSNSPFSTFDDVGFGSNTRKMLGTLDVHGRTMRIAVLSALSKAREFRVCIPNNNAVAKRAQ